MDLVPITITRTDSGATLWRATDCADHCKVTANTFLGYVSAGRAPKPITHLDKRTPLFDAEEVKAWHAARPGSPVRNAPRAKGR